MRLRLTTQMYPHKEGLRRVVRVQPHYQQRIIRPDLGFFLHECRHGHSQEVSIPIYLPRHMKATSQYRGRDSLTQIKPYTLTNSLYAPLIMARPAVVIAVTAILLALNAIASPLGFWPWPLTAPKLLRCDRASFAGVLPAEATLEKVAVVREGGSYGEGNANIPNPTNPTNLPALCAVTVRVMSSASSSYRFGLFLPEKWNSRFLVVGNGGFGGGINWLDMYAPTPELRRGCPVDTELTIQCSRATVRHDLPLNRHRPQLIRNRHQLGAEPA